MYLKIKRKKIKYFPTFYYHQKDYSFNFHSKCMKLVFHNAMEYRIVLIVRNRTCLESSFALLNDNVFKNKRIALICLLMPRMIYSQKEFPFNLHFGLKKFILLDVGEYCITLVKLNRN